MTLREPPAVTTDAGTVSGKAGGDGTVAYLGIPYAAAPIGPNRFLAPQPVTPWTGVRACTEYGPTPQRRPFGDMTTIPEPSLPGEDTLSVNVFAPESRSFGLRPVLVWVHGGGYFAGSPASPWYDGTSFAKSGIVVVTLSYRLGFDGFGWIRDAPLNRGILDQIAALTWVRRNIAAFGGDPERVTIAGQSAGGGSVLTLMTSPRARGLFRSVIAHSAAPGHVHVPQAEEVARRFAESVGVEPTRAGWGSLTEDQILDREREFNTVPGSTAPGAPPREVVDAMRRDPMSMGLVFAPVIDDESVVDVAEAISSGVADDVALLLGSTRNEFVFPSEVPAADVADVLLASGASTRAVDGFVREVDAIGARYASSQLAVMSMFRVPAMHIASRRTHDAAARTWLYDFAYHSPVDGTSAHCYDIPFAWGLPEAEGVERVLGVLPPSLVESMHSTWVEFVSTNTASWPDTGHDRAGAMVFDLDGGYDPSAYLLESEVLNGR